MVSWTHIHLEAYCMFSSASKKKWKTVEWETKREHIIENKNYIPKTKRPNWCKKQNKKRIPQYRCLSLNCPFLAYCNSDKKDYKLFDGAYDKKYKKGKKKI